MVRSASQEIRPDAGETASSCLNSVTVSYGCGRYLSHTRVARVYRNLLRSRCRVVKETDRADMVVLHFEPHSFGALFDAYPALKRKYIVGYCVWEASHLPVAYQEAISGIPEIWTCSGYCCEVLQKHHPQVKYVPHVIERDTCYSEADRESIRQLISYDPQNFYFLTVTKLWDLRKNTRALAAAFVRQRPAMQKARLIIKAGPQDDLEGLPNDGVIVLRENLTEGQMNALYATSDAYVSAHHSEGWGLTLSDAMIFQKPVIATGYSGNCEFMNGNNSLLLDFTEDHIRPEDCFHFFDSSMKWAYPSTEDLQQRLLFVYEKRDSVELRQKIRNASNDIEKFNRNSVGAILGQRIADIVHSDRFSHMVARG